MTFRDIQRQGYGYLKLKPHELRALTIREFILMMQGVSEYEEMQTRRVAWGVANIMNALGASVTVDDLLQKSAPKMSIERLKQLKEEAIKEGLI